ncbi:MatE family protein [Leishmania donovani]|uniref:MatE family protein n=1 Tax=Leishmania donovani TaxID=5661 RepID=A0A504XEU6_LEIDO|nr:MatE family protein [Leishmania donovani]
MSHPSLPSTRRMTRERADASVRTPSIGHGGAAPVLVFDAPQVRESCVKQRHYGTMQGSSNVMVRSSSMPERSSRMAYVRKHSRQLTVGQQSARLAEKAKRNYFHGSFTSAHGSVFTVPNKAQQMATNRPSRAPLMAYSSVSRSTLAARRRPTPISLDVSPAVSAIKKTATSPIKAGSSSHEGNDTDTSLTIREPNFLDGSIVLPRRAVSADARLGGHHSLDMSTSISKLRLSISGADLSASQLSEMTFRDSSPDFLAVQLMRDHSAKQKQKQLLSPTTISRAVRALRAFEERKMRFGGGAHSNARDVNNADDVVSALDRTPSAQAVKKSETPLIPAVARCVRIKPDAEGNVAEEAIAGFEEDEDESFESGDSFSWFGATMDLLYLAVPAAVSICFTFSMSVVPLSFVGRYLGPRQLTGASVGYFLLSILITYPTIGLTFALDTLCSHEYGRNPLSPEMGLVLQRGALINLIILIPLCVCIYTLDSILVPLYGKVLAEEAEEFLLYSPLYLIPMVLFISMNKFLNNQMQPHIPMIALTAGVILTPFLQLKLTPMGVRYTMLGMAITAWFQLAIVTVITVFKRETRITLGKWRIAEALDWTDVKEYMKLAVPSAIFVAAEASSFDVTVLMCARFGEVDGAAWSGIMNCLFIFASFPGGLSASACANIGRCIGAYEPASAKRFVRVSILITFVVGLVDSALLVAFFDRLMSFFGTEGTTLELAREVLYLLPILHVCDAVQFTFQGIFSGMGKNYIGALILLTSLWGVGVPLAFLLGEYLGYRTFGVCVGITIGLCIEAPVMVYSASTTNYVAVAELTEGNLEHYRKLLPPRRCGRPRRVVEYQDEDD